MAASNSLDQGDLKNVKGIGPTIEARLKEAGITTLGQLARTPVNELEAALKGLRGGYDADRITREDWLSQAAALAAAPAAAAAEDEPAEQVRHNFTVEVQLAIAGRDVTSSKIFHMQTRDEDAWSGWDRQRLVAFIEDRAGLRPSVPAPATEGEALPVTKPEPGPGDAGEGTGLALHTFAMVPASGPEVTASGSISAILSFDAATAALPGDQRARAKVDIYVRRPPPEKSIPVGGTVAEISPGEPVRIEIPCCLPATGQPVGLFAAVQLFAAIAAGSQPSSILPEARLTVSRPSAAAPGDPGAAA